MADRIFKGDVVCRPLILQYEVVAKHRRDWGLPACGQRRMLLGIDEVGESSRRKRLGRRGAVPQRLWRCSRVRQRRIAIPLLNLTCVALLRQSN